MLVLAAGVAAAQPELAPLAQRAAQVVQDVARDARFNGAVVLMRDGQVVFSQAVGLAQRDPDVAYTVDTPSDGASLAKTLTAALVHELAAQGRLSLDDRVAKVWPCPRST